MRRFSFVFCFLFFFSAASGQSQTAPDSLYLIQDSVSIPTRSGVAISAIIVRKTNSTDPLPAVLFYTTYFQGPTDANIGKRSADRNYVGIVAYARGIRTNLEAYLPFEHEATDVYDVIDWISKQSWCNGSVGMFGGSYTGFSQWSAVKNPHPALKTIVPQVAVMPGYDFPMENNVPLSHILAWSHDNIYKYKPLSRDLVFDYFNSGVAYNRMDSLAGYENSIFRRWLQHPSYDAYWAALVPSAEEYARLQLPVLSTTGYYDGSQIGAMQYFRLHNRYNASANHYLVIGPYDHWGGQRMPAKNLMGYAIDSVAQISMLELAYQWMDHILKDKPKPALLKNKVNYQVMGTNTWKHVSSLLDTRNDTLRLFLDQGMLSTRKPKKHGFESMKVDFKDREKQQNYYTPELIFSQLDSSNGLVFTSKPFDQDFAINGSFAGSLKVTMNKKDMDVSLALYEQMADGTYFFLTRYVGRASYAHDNTKRRLLHPGRSQTIRFSNTRFVSRQIRKGSRLVVLLNINKHPFEVINYGSGNPVSSETILDAGEPMQLKWHNESYLSIPIWKDK
jgi:uncharacterized protein